MLEEIRPAEEADTVAMARIHAEGVEDRIATFTTEPYPPELFLERIRGARPVLVCVRDGGVVGWASVQGEDPRPGLRDVGDYSVFVARAARGTGVGTRLLRALCDAAAEAGLHKLLGRIFASNGPSIAIGKACGFREVGILREHGELEGQRRDVVLLEKLL